MKNILRWIAVPFAAVLAMIAGYVLGKTLQAFCLNWVLFGAKDLILVISEFSGELTGGVCFVAAGVAVAPHGKRVVSLILATIIILLCVASVLYHSVIEFEIMKIVYSLGMSIGAIGFTYDYCNKNRL